MNRPLIRSTLAEVKDQAGGGPGARKKPVPPEQTHAESYYYLKQMQAKTPMVIVLTDGEVLRGTIEWYDKNCIKITRTAQPNLLLYKSSIKYLYKESDGSGSARREDPELETASVGRDHK
jgi:sRNA-binding regulator protein Hfq